jgi:hypothetical protein
MVLNLLVNENFHPIFVRVFFSDALKTFDTSRQTMPGIQSFEQLRDTARNTRDLIKQRATHYIDCYRVER